METTEIPTVGQVVGRNLARLRVRRGRTQKEAAGDLRASGLAWTAATIASIESGRREGIEFGELVLLAHAYDVPVAEFFQGEGEVRLSGEATVELAALRRWLAGAGELVVTLSGLAAKRALGLIPGETVSFQADAELAARLGLRPEDVSAAAEKLWGRTLHQERERRLAELGEMTPAQRRSRRGHITRRLARELEPYLLKALARNTGSEAPAPAPRRCRQVRPLNPLPVG